MYKIKTNISLHSILSIGDLKKIYWYLWEHVWLWCQKEVRVAVTMIPTTYIGYDITFDLGSNITDFLGGARMKTLPDIFENIADESNSDDIDNELADYSLSSSELSDIEIEDEDQDENKNENQDEDQEENKERESAEFCLKKKQKRSKLLCQFLLTGNSMEFVYQILIFPGLCIFQFYFNCISILFQFYVNSNL